MTFHDRRDELAALADAAESPGHAFYVVYGRRRVGKTELLKEFCSERPHIYFLAAEEAEHRQREKFVERVAEQFGDRVPRIDGWDDALDYLGERLVEQQTIVVIDEFPRLIDESDSLLSYLQAFVDEHLGATESMLVLCGSSVSTMESEVLGHESPLYGRRTGQIDLAPFSIRQARSVLADPFEEAVRSFAVTGGTPMYLTLFDVDRSIAENIRREILDPTSILHTEPEFLLRTELRTPARYMSILEAIARGATTPNEIAGATGIESGPLSKYLQTLRRLRLVTREVPVTASNKQSNRSQYLIGDPYLQFWFRFVEPNRSTIEQAPDRVLEGTIEPALPDHVASVFESICRETIWAATEQGRLDPYADVGRWWYGEDEIDLVALAPDDERILFAECKWTEDPVGPGLAHSLLEKSDRVRWGPATRDERFALFSKSGFTDELRAAFGDWALFDIDDLDETLTPIA